MTADLRERIFREVLPEIKAVFGGRDHLDADELAEAGFVSPTYLAETIGVIKQDSELGGFVPGWLNRRRKPGRTEGRHNK